MLGKHDNLGSPLIGTLILRKYLLTKGFHVFFRAIGNKDDVGGTTTYSFIG